MLSQQAVYSRTEVDARIQAAVAAAETRQDQKTTQLVHELVDRADQEHSSRLIAENQIEQLRELNYQQKLQDGALQPVGAETGGPR